MKIKHQTMIYFAQQTYRNAMYYGKYDSKMANGNVFGHCDFERSLVTVAVSSEDGLFLSVVKMAKSWI